MGSVTTDRYYSELPVWAGGNLYFNGARPMSKESDAYVDSVNHIDVGYEVTSDDTAGTGANAGTYGTALVKLKSNLFDVATKLPDNAKNGKLMRTEDIAPAFEPEQNYENPDGTPIVFDTDFNGKKRGEKTIAGPFAI